MWINIAPESSNGKHETGAKRWKTFNQSLVWENMQLVPGVRGKCFNLLSGLIALDSFFLAPAN